MENNIKLIYFETDEVLVKFTPLLPIDADYNEEDNIIIGAIDMDKMCPVGIIVCTPNGPELVIEHLYVVPEYRLNGIGTMMIDKIREIALEKIEPIDVSCAFFVSNSDLFEFFLATKGILLDSVSKQYKVTKDDLASSPALSKTSSKNKYSISSIADSAHNLDYYKKVILRNNDALEDADFEGLNEELSHVIIAKEDDKIEGYILVAERDDEDLEVVYLYNNNPKNSSAVPLLMSNAFSVYRDKYYEKSVYFTDINNDGTYERIIPGIKPIDTVFIARLNFDSYIDDVF